MRPFLLPLLLLFFIRQFLDIASPIILECQESPMKDVHFSVFDLIYILTLLLSSKSDFCQKRSEQLFWLGLIGMGEMAFAWLVMGMKDVLLFYMFSFFVAIGPVLSICLIIDEQIPVRNSIWTYLFAILVLTIDQLPLPILLIMLLLSSAHILYVIGSGDEEDEEEIPRVPRQFRNWNRFRRARIRYRFRNRPQPEENEDFEWI